MQRLIDASGRSRAAHRMSASPHAGAFKLYRNQRACYTVFLSTSDKFERSAKSEPQQPTTAYRFRQSAIHAEELGLMEQGDGAGDTTWYPAHGDLSDKLSDQSTVIHEFIRQRWMG